MHRHIGIFSGTFDPVHEGHVAFANVAVNTFHLDKVIFIPEKKPRLKQHASDISKRQLALNEALRSYPKLESAILSTDQFTVIETLPELHHLFPGSKFTLLMGSDVASHISTWHDLPILMADASLLIAIRGGDSAMQVENTLANLEKSIGVPIRYTIIHSPKPMLRSSDLRK